MLNKIICLNKGQSTKKCKSSGCRKCGRIHHTLLHFKSKEHTPQLSAAADVFHPATSSNYTDALTSLPLSSNQEQGKINSLTSHNTIQSQCLQHTVLLSTAVIHVFDKAGNIHSWRLFVFLVSGSQSNFISEHLCRILNLRKQKTNFTISGIGQTVETTKYKLSIKIKSNNSTYENVLSCFVLPNITYNVPLISFPRSSFNIPNNIT